MLSKLVYMLDAVAADRRRDGHVLIAGDAMHMTAQFIGQGMNSGGRGADDLSRRLTPILCCGADPAILDSYETERRPQAKPMIGPRWSTRNLVSMGNPAWRRPAISA